MTDRGDDSLTLGEIAQRIAGSRRFVLGAGAAGLGLGLLLALVLPRVYIGEATLLPSSDERATGLDPDLLGFAGRLGMPMPPSAAPESRLFPSILKSDRLLRAALAAPLDSSRAAGSDGSTATLLDRVSRRPPDDRLRMEKAVARVRHRVLRVSFDEETGIVRVAVRLSDPEEARRTCEILLDELSDFLRTERARRARENREFVASRREEASGALREAEDALRRFRETNRRISGAPDLVLEEARLAREVRLQEELYLELSRQFELARIDEQKATPLVEVLDPPTPRYEPASPRAPIYAGMGMLAGVLFASLAAALLEPRKPS